jgi:hypothetical protein
MSRNTGAASIPFSADRRLSNATFPVRNARKVSLPTVTDNQKKHPHRGTILEVRSAGFGKSQTN